MTTVVWARNADFPPGTSRMLALAIAQRKPEFDSLPHDRVVDGMTWRAVPSWYAERHQIPVEAEPNPSKR